MAAPDTIPTDLTLEIDQNLSPDRFLAATRAFFGYVQEVGKALFVDGPPDWVVSVKDGSNLVAVDPGPNTPIEVVNAVYGRIESGIAFVENGDIDSARLPEPALKHLRALAEITERPRDAAPTIRIWVRKRPVAVNGTIAANIREDWRSDYKDFGTVEGRLESIQDRDGTLKLQVRDAMLRQTIPCYFPEEMLADAFQMFRKRVEVSGTIHYRHNGKAISIEVTNIEKLPDDDELPSADDVRGILKLNA